MPKPVILTVDDDPDVLAAIARDLRAHYGKDYRILRADSADSGLETLGQLRERLTELPSPTASLPKPTGDARRERA